MSVALFDGRVRLEGECRVEDAETLLTLLQSDPGRVVDVTGVRHVHAAVLQVLMALRPRIDGITRGRCHGALDFDARFYGYVR